MHYLIVGLGNPGNAYNWTRHNIGFETINKMAYDNNISLTKTKHWANIGTGFIGGAKVILAKPYTYMNKSGESIEPLLKYYNIPIENLIVIHDEIALDVGRIQIKYGGGAGGHKGVLDAIDHLKTQGFLRVRIGVGAKPPGFRLTEYVLSRFFVQEHDTIVAAVGKAGEAVSSILIHGKDKAMNIHNQKAVEQQ
ncbi:MAG: aminoacyl-tRNA hydrolase [Defluviitaleaceae bacterium]|nr:aminoacyl-tRNA hydrolase [Defluviitaleaceae bacterium]